MRHVLILVATLVAIAPATAAEDCRTAIRDAEQFIAAAPALSSVEHELPLEDCLRKLQALEAKVRRLLKHFDQAPQRQVE